MRIVTGLKSQDHAPELFMLHLFKRGKLPSNKVDKAERKIDSFITASTLFMLLHILIDKRITYKSDANASI